MVTRIAINGFGRIGRLTLRSAMEDSQGSLEFVAVNDLQEANELATLLRHDSAHGDFPGEVDYEGESIIVDGNEIPVYSKKDPKELPWDALDVDIVAECTGAFTHGRQSHQHLDAGASKVLVSAPCKCDGGTCPPEIAKTVVKGVNEDTYNPEEHDVVSNASCTTNCAAPIMKVLDDNFGVVEGYLSTVHGYTASQNLVDTAQDDLRRARAAAQNIIPTSTGAAQAVTEVLPKMEGRLDAIAFRVPVIAGSITDFSVKVGEDVTEGEINDIFREVSQGELEGIVGYNDEAIVSSDIVTDPHSAILDADFTNVLRENMVKVLAWYDNEWGFSCRMVEMLEYMGERL